MQRSPLATSPPRSSSQGEQLNQVETQTSDLSGTVTGKQISQLQLNGRNYTQLLALSPGATNQSGQDEPGKVLSTVAYSVNGGRTEYNNWEIDGGNNMDDGSNTTLLSYPSLDSIAEVRRPDFQLRRAIWPKQFRHGRSRDQVRHQQVPWRRVRICSQRQVQCPQLLHRFFLHIRRTISASPSAARSIIPRLYNRQEQDFLLLLGGMAARDRVPGQNSTSPCHHARSED